MHRAAPRATVPIATFAGLMLAMEAEHDAADPVLQTDWMARGEDRTAARNKPLAVNTGQFGLGILGITPALAPALSSLAPIDEGGRRSAGATRRDVGPRTTRGATL